MSIPTNNMPYTSIISTITLVLVGIVLGSNPRRTSTLSIVIPTGGCALPNIGFPYGGAYQGQNIQVFNVNPFGLPNTCLGSSFHKELPSPKCILNKEKVERDKQKMREKENITVFL